MIFVKFQKNLPSGSFYGPSQNTGTFTMEYIGYCHFRHFEAYIKNTTIAILLKF